MGKETGGHVTGIGGIFFKARDPAGLGMWYRECLGIDADQGHARFWWREEASDERAYTVWTAMPEGTGYIGPPSATFMICYRVSDLAALLEGLRAAGADVDERGIEELEYGRFAWVTDPEGNRLELWEPPRRKTQDHEES